MPTTFLITAGVEDRSCIARFHDGMLFLRSLIYFLVFAMSSPTVMFALYFGQLVFFLAP